jgi:hypothetical protein
VEMSNIADKIVVIARARRGIGESTARLLALLVRRSGVCPRHQSEFPCSNLESFHFQ